MITTRGYVPDADRAKRKEKRKDVSAHRWLVLAVVVVIVAVVAGLA